MGLRAHSPVAKLQNVFRYYGHFSKWSENLRDYFLGGEDDFKRVYFFLPKRRQPAAAFASMMRSWSGSGNASESDAACCDLKCGR